jgi:hypothetical protein
MRADDAIDPRKRRGRGPLDDEACLAIGATPNNCAITGDVANLNALSQLRPIGGDERGDLRMGEASERPCRQRGTRDG